MADTPQQPGQPKPYWQSDPIYNAGSSALKAGANTFKDMFTPHGRPMVPGTAPQPGVQGPTAASAGPVGVKAPETPVAGPAANAAPASASVAPVASVPQINIPAPTAAKSMPMGMDDGPMSIPNMQTSVNYLKDQLAKPWNDMDFKGLNAMAVADKGKYWSPNLGPRPAAQPAATQPRPADPIVAQLQSNATEAMSRTGRYQGVPIRVGEPDLLAEHAHEMLGKYMQSQSQIGLANAQAASLDPSKQIGLMREVNQDPALRDLYLAGKGMPAGSAGPAPMSPGAQVNAGNFAQWAGQQSNQALGGLLGGPEAATAPLQEIIEKASQFPGVGDPNHPNHQALRTYMGQRYADRSLWAKEQPENQWMPNVREAFGSKEPERQRRALALIRQLGVEPQAMASVRRVGGEPRYGP